MTKEDLDLMPAGDLLAALAKRFDGFMFLAYKDETAALRQIIRDVGGDKLIMLGLLTQSVHNMCDTYFATLNDIEKTQPTE